MIKVLILGSLIVMVTPARASSDAAQLAFQARNYSEAIILFEKKLVKNEKDVSVHLFLARIAVKNEKYDLAEEHIVKAKGFLELSEDSQFDNAFRAELYYWLGSIMEMQAEKSSIFSASSYAESSLNGYLKSVDLLPTNLKYREGLINFYLDAPSIFGGSIDNAIEQAQVTFEQNPKFGYKMLANCYEKDGNTKMILATYKEAIASYPLDNELFLKRGSYWRAERIDDKAFADFQHALSLPAVSSHQKAVRLMSLYYQGRISSFTGKYLKLGIESYQQVLDFNEDLGDEFIPSREWTQFRMAKLMVLDGKKKEAEVIFTKLLNSTDREDLKNELIRVVAQ